MTILLSISGILIQDSLLIADAQTNNNKLSSTSSNLTNFIINIREISSTTEENLIALLSSENDVQIKRVDISEATIQPGEEDSFSPNKMIDVPITMNKPVETDSEIYACIIQLGNDSYSQSIKCNIAYASPTASGEPQRIIVLL
jgi:hypothetical protein